MATTNCHQQLWHCLHYCCHCLWWQTAVTLSGATSKVPVLPHCGTTAQSGCSYVKSTKDHHWHWQKPLRMSHFYDDAVITHIRKAVKVFFFMLDDIFFSGKWSVDCRIPFRHVNIDEFNGIRRSTDNKWMITKKIITMSKNSTFHGKATLNFTPWTMVVRNLLLQFIKTQ